jgi:hypothetical protein
MEKTVRLACFIGKYLWWREGNGLKNLNATAQPEVHQQPETVALSNV